MQIEVSKWRYNNKEITNQRWFVRGFLVEANFSSRKKEEKIDVCVQK